MLGPRAAVVMKKEREFQILSSVLGAGPTASIVPSENPDFRVRPQGRNREFGAEITEFYPSESHARVQNRPGYVSQILDSGEYIHRDDQAMFPVGPAQLYAADGTPKGSITGIFTEILPPADYFAKVSSLIDRKNARYHDYAEGLSHVILVIHDNSLTLSKFDSATFSTLFYASDIAKSIAQCGFSEVYLVTRFRDFPQRRCVPAKALLFFQLIYAYLHGARVYQNEGGVSDEIVFGSLLPYLRQRGGFMATLSEHPSGLSVDSVSAKAIVSEDSGLSLIVADPAGEPLSKDPELHLPSDRDLVSHCLRYSTENTVGLSISFLAHGVLGQTNHPDLIEPGRA